MSKRKSKVDVRSVDGLQDILTEGVENLFETPSTKRDQNWTRLNVMCTNSGNALIRTKMKQDEMEQRSSKKKNAKKKVAKKAKRNPKKRK